MMACKHSGYLPDEDGQCKCGDKNCLVEFVRVEPLFGMEQWKAWFLSGPGMLEQQVSREDYVKAERAAGFYPKPGLGPEATGAFSSGGLSGRTVTTWPGRTAAPDS